MSFSDYFGCLSPGNLPVIGSDVLECMNLEGTLMLPEHAVVAVKQESPNVYDTHQQQQTVQLKEEPLLQNENKMPSFVCTTDYPGEHEFEVYVNPHHGKKSPWVYSSALSKIFIGMNQTFPIDFKWNIVDERLLYVRAVPIYSQSQHSTDIVTRCINHAHDAEATNKGFGEQIWDHIVRCHHRHAVYGGSKAERRHLFVRVPLDRPPTGSDSYQLQYQFMCKNSCGSESGMNRRPIQVVFTLEDHASNILGRRVLQVRICSCPKRDKEKEESDFYKRPETAKKRKLEKKILTASQESSTSDNKEFDLSLHVVGTENAKMLCKMAYLMMADKAAQSNNPSFKEHEKVLKQKMNGLF